MAVYFTYYYKGNKEHDLSPFCGWEVLHKENGIDRVTLEVFTEMFCTAIDDVIQKTNVEVSPSDVVITYWNMIDYG